MPENTISRVSGSGPSFVSVEPDASMPDPAKSLMCIDRASAGAEGTSGAGTEALVKRFSDASGAGGASGYVHGTPDEYESCDNEALNAAVSCTAAAIAASTTAGVALLLTGVKCVADLRGLAECLENEPR